MTAQHEHQNHQSSPKSSILSSAALASANAFSSSSAAILAASAAAASSAAILAASASWAKRASSNALTWAAFSASAAASADS